MSGKVHVRENVHALICKMLREKKKKQSRKAGSWRASDLVSVLFLSAVHWLKALITRVVRACVCVCVQPDRKSACESHSVPDARSDRGTRWLMEARSPESFQTAALHLLSCPLISGLRRSAALMLPLAERPSKGRRAGERESERGAQPPPLTFAPPFFSPRLFIRCPRSQRNSLSNSAPTPHCYTHLIFLVIFRKKKIYKRRF